jgi:hypothetical protein
MQTLIASAPTAVTTAPTGGFFYGPITRAQVAARLQANQAVNLQQPSDEQRLDTAIKGLRARNITRHNLLVGKVSLLIGAPTASQPLVGQFGHLHGDSFTVTNEQYEPLEIVSGARVLAVAVTTTSPQRILALVGEQRVLLTPRQATLAATEQGNLLTAVCVRLRDLQDVPA